MMSYFFFVLFFAKFLYNLFLSYLLLNIHLTNRMQKFSKEIFLDPLLIL